MDFKYAFMLSRKFSIKWAFDYLIISLLLKSLGHYGGHVEFDVDEYYKQVERFKQKDTIQD